MSGIQDPRDADFEKANSRLAAGLKSCRTVVESYRVMLSGETDKEDVVPAESGKEPGADQAQTP